MLYCEHPFIVKSDDGNRYQVGCGKCLSCLKSKRWQWSQRLHAEFVHSVCTKFVTLTYDEQSFLGIRNELNKGIELTSHIYIEDDDVCFPNVSKRDCQLFFKRLRKSFTDVLGNFKYFLVSEFGDRTGRPHYHCIMFFDKYISNSELQLMILKTWKLGYILDVQDVKGSGAFSYLTNYMYKQVGDVDIDSKMMDIYNENHDNMQYVYTEQEKYRNRPKTFMLASRRPAIGMSYLSSPQRIKFHKSSILNTTASMKGYPTNIPLCSYLKNKVYSKDEVALINAHFQKEERDRIDKYIESKGITYDDYHRKVAEIRKNHNYNLRHKEWN